MSSAKLIRWSGFSLMLGGIALAIHYFTHPAGESAQYTLQPLWRFSHWIGGFAALLMVFGWMGVYLYQSEKAGLLGLIGFVLEVIGTALYAGGEVIFGALMQPVLAVQAPALLDAGSPLVVSAARPALMIMYLPFLLGFLLLGLATLRTRMLPSLGSWLMILVLPIGVVGVALEGTSLQLLFQIAGGLAGGLAMLLWGYALWSARDPATAKKA